MFSRFLVICQFGSLGAIVWYCGVPLHDGLFFAISGCSGLLGIWSIAVMRVPNLRVLPEPKRDAELRTSGPYRIIRHPMYLSVILLAAAFITTRPDETSAALFFLLLFTLLSKIHYEEKLMRNTFPEYAEYASGTWRLIPFLY